MFIDEFGLVNLLNYPSDSSVHLLIIDAPKGIATGFSAYRYNKQVEESLFLAWA